MSFPRAGSAIRPERIAQAFVRTKDGDLNLPERRLQPNALRLATPRLPSGEAIVGVRLHPRALELTDAQVEHYFEEIAVRDEVRRHWSSLQGRTRWKETYVKHAKTCVVVGNAADGAGCTTPIGLPLELMPLAPPPALRAGQRGRFRLLWQGAALANVSVGLMTEKGGQRVFSVTDTQGEAEFALGTSGRALLFAVYLRPAVGAPTWVSDFATSTFQIGERE